MKFEEIVAIGNDELLIHIGDLYKDNEKFKEAMQHYEAAYKMGSGKAAYVLGEIYGKGNLFTEKNMEKSLEYYEDAKNRGYPPAFTMLGHHYYNNGSHKEAYPYFKEGHKRGEKHSTFNLGLSYFHGNGVTKDLNKALKYYIRSYELGVHNALNKIGLFNSVEIINFIKSRSTKFQHKLDTKDAHISVLESKITELKFRPPELGGPEYEAAKAHFAETQEQK